MEDKRYLCPQCFVRFTVLVNSRQEPVSCPRCGQRDVPQNESCTVEVGPPPWEFLCRECKSRFEIEAPQGPQDIAALTCPVCRSERIKWLALATAGCGSGG